MSVDTIAAIATAPGAGGIGVVRISGPLSIGIAEQLSGISPKPRQAHFVSFKNAQRQLIDTGLLLYFPNPASFTGEDVIECQIHGGQVVLNMLLQEVLFCGARMARAGEFSERAFLNDKIDLIQAEAIADIISSGSEQAVAAAQRSLQGEFSQHIKSLLDQLIQTRVWLESAIDFPEEEIDFLSDQQLHDQLSELQLNLHLMQEKAQTGIILNKGIHIALIGIPNAGKSSLLNVLTQEDAAIVSSLAGTTRDVIKQDIHIEGIPIRLVDTAGIHETENEIEQLGIQRARSEAMNADVILWVIDATVDLQQQLAVIESFKDHATLIPVINKKDQMKQQLQLDESFKPASTLSAKTGEGVQNLQKRIVELVSGGVPVESTFSARTRHLDHLQKATEHVDAAADYLKKYNQGELSAEELRLAQDQLGHITGRFSSDDLLGEIFSSFCIGK